MKRTTILVAAIVFLLAGCSKVKEYETAVKQNQWTGAVADHSYGQGLRPAFFVTYHKFPTGREVQYPTNGEESDIVEALTNDQLTIHVEGAFRYSIDPTKVYDVYMQIGDVNAVHQFVYNAYREAVRDAVAGIPAADILSRDLDTGIDARIEQLLSRKTAPRGIVITEFFLRNIDPPKRLREAIETKLAREQEVSEQRYKTQIVQEQANQKREEAAGIRDAQEIIAQSLEGARGQRYLYWRYLEVLGEIGKGNNNMVIAPTESGIPLFLNGAN